MKLGPASRASVERTRYCVVGSSRVVWFNATFLLNGSDERQRSGRIKAVGCWFEAGRCEGPLRVRRMEDGVIDKLDVCLLCVSGTKQSCCACPGQVILRCRRRLSDKGGVCVWGEAGAGTALDNQIWVGDRRASHMQPT